MSEVGAGPRSGPAEGSGSNGQPSRLQRINALLGKRRSTVVWITLFAIVAGLAEAAILAGIAQLATNLVRRTSTIYLQLGPLHLHTTPGTMIEVLFGLAILRLLLQVPLSVLPALVAADVQADLRRRIFAAYSRASWESQSNDREGTLQETMSGQVTQASSGAQQATQLIITFFMFITLMGAAFVLNPFAAFGVMAAALVMFAVLRPLRSLGVRRSRELSRAQVAYASGVAESVRVAEETRVFGVEHAQYSRIDTLVEKARGLNVQTQTIAKLVPNLYQSLIVIALVAALAILHSAHVGHAASLGAVVLLLLRAATNGQMLQACYQAIQQAMPFIERTQGAAMRYEHHTEHRGSRPLAQISTLAFDHVGYGYYKDRPVLQEVTFEVQRGDSVGIIGPSGAGKSTMVSLLLQLRAPSNGAYLVNGEAAAEFDPADWNRQVSYVPQEPRLLHASVAENIRYYRDIDDATVEQAARMARIHEDIVSWPKGYDTLVGPRADAVSGGQQQRVCLARALVAQPEVLILDEPTSALDPHSESLIQESLSALRNRLTLFIIAHRMSTLDICETVMVVIDGRLVAYGPKPVLASSNQYYRSAISLAASASGAQLI